MHDEALVLSITAEQETIRECLIISWAVPFLAIVYNARHVQSTFLEETAMRPTKKSVTCLCLPVSNAQLLCLHRLVRKHSDRVVHASATDLDIAKVSAKTEGL